MLKCTLQLQMAQNTKHISIASENKRYILAKSLSGDNITAHMGAFSFPLPCHIQTVFYISGCLHFLLLSSGYSIEIYAKCCVH